MDLDSIPLFQSPNCRSRGTVKITHIVIHAMSGFMAGTLQRFKDPKSQVSAHYGVGRDGKIVRYVTDDLSAWHVVDANPFCLGIEHEDMFQNNDGRIYGGCMGNLAWTTPSQLNASATLTAALMQKYNVPLTNVIGHNDPFLRHYRNNHQDPGALFPWNTYRFLVKEAVIRQLALPVPQITPEEFKALAVDSPPPAKPVNKGGRPRKVPRVLID